METHKVLELDVVTREAMGESAGEDLPDLLLVHGACHTAAHWEPFQEQFAQMGYRSHAVNLNGHGKSPCRRQRVTQNTLRDYLLDVRDVIGQLGLQRFILIGHSMGGFIAQYYLYQLAQPDLIGPTGVVLLSASSSYQSRRAWKANLRQFGRYLWPTLHAWLSKDFYYVVGSPARTRGFFFTSDTPQDIVEGCFRMLQSDSFQATVQMLSLLSPEAGHALPKPIPLLILGGGRDAIVSPVSLEASAEAFGGASFHIFNDMGHDLMLDVGHEQVARTIVGWIATQLLP